MLCLWCIISSSSASRSLATASHDGQHPHGLQRRPECPSHNFNLTEQAILSDPAALKAFISDIPKVFGSGTWLQIGANTLDPLGHTYQVEDPLLQYLPLFDAYRKVLVEPIPPLFEKLKNNTKNMPHTELVNAAIVADHSAGKTVTMYCPTPEEMVEWLVGICSMDESVIKRASNSGRSERYEVPALTTSSLMRNYNIQDVRVVMIDTEGFDVKILKMLPFQKPSFRPQLVVFENTEISDEEHEEGKEFLRSHCYFLAHDRENTFGLRLA